MVEFSSIAETGDTEQPLLVQEPEEPEPEAQQVEENLEALVEAHTEELQAPQVEEAYVDEPSSPQSEYQPQQQIELRETTNIKQEFRPLAYEENEVCVVVDIFERYGKKEDTWWKERTQY